jgi:hypothetical protein
VGLGFELRVSTCKAGMLPLESLYQSISVGHFGDGFSQNIYPGWSQTLILLISASQVARITGMSHWHLAVECFYKCLSTIWRFFFCEVPIQVFLYLCNLGCQSFLIWRGSLYIPVMSSFSKIYIANILFPICLYTLNFIIKEKFLILMQ